MKAKTKTETRTPPILQPGETCWVVSPAHETGLLIDCCDYFRAFVAAARAARRSILLAGWQFDSDVDLLRGNDGDAGGAPLRLVEFLRGLCQANPELQIRILCWDYSPAFYFDREWFQDRTFNAAAPGQLVFRFDDRHPVGGSHHQKFVVVDGALAFAGSTDLCHARWDRRTHPAQSEERCPAGVQDVRGPNHEVHMYMCGPAAVDLEELFCARWLSSGGEPLVLPPPLPHLPVRIRPSVRLGPTELGLSRTVPETLMPSQQQIREVESLMVAAIEAAEHLIYAENQYFCARVVLEAFERRMRDPTRPKLQIVLVAPYSLRSVTERVSMGHSQAYFFAHLRRLAAEHGHAFGAYSVHACQVDAEHGGAGTERDVFIHAKLMVVDDRFLTVGSANLNNRSMGLDSELNVSCEEEESTATTHLRRAIRRARVSLLAEHLGVHDRAVLRSLYPIAGLVARLDRLAADPSTRLRHRPAAALAGGPATADEFCLDLERPLGAMLFERISPSNRDFVRAGWRRARRKLKTWRHRLRRRRAANRPMRVARRPDLLWTGVSQYARRFSVPAVLLVGGGVVVWSGVALVRALL